MYCVYVINLMNNICYNLLYNINYLLIKNLHFVYSLTRL